MALTDDIEKFKAANPDKTSFVFKNGSRFTGAGAYKLHWFIDSIYSQAVNEWRTNKTTNNADYLKKLIL